MERLRSALSLGFLRHIHLFNKCKKFLRFIIYTSFDYDNNNFFPSYIIKNNVEGDKSGIAILNNTTLGIHCTQEMQTKWTVKCYDCLRTHKMPNQGFVCWGTSGIEINNLALLNTVVADICTILLFVTSNPILAKT